MNRTYVLWNLREAYDQLSAMVNAIETDTEYDAEQFNVDMVHLYNHLNIAWNARESTMTEATNCSADDFQRWRQFPDDIDMSAV